MFDQIAKDWKQKRQHPWKPFTDLASKWISIWQSKYSFAKESSLFLDLGAGSGRHSQFLLTFCTRLIDLDISLPMIKLNTSRSIKIQSSLDFLPFRENVFDGMFSIAALHHIKGKNNREKVRDEIQYIGKINSLICFSVWRFYQKKFIDEYYRQFQELSFKVDKVDKFEFGDTIIPWTLSHQPKKQIIERFYHLFRASEFHLFRRPFRKLYQGLMGNREEKTNFIFFGENQ
jgi:SAM-dependent methyltransferase